MADEDEEKMVTLFVSRLPASGVGGSSISCVSTSSLISSTLRCRHVIILHRVILVFSSKVTVEWHPPQIVIPQRGPNIDPRHVSLWMGEREKKRERGERAGEREESSRSREHLPRAIHPLNTPVHCSTMAAARLNGVRGFSRAPGGHSSSFNP